MDDQELKQHIRNTFNTISNHYDCEALRFFADAARQLPMRMSLQGHEQVLDVATGTAYPALAMATALPTGKVVGIDLSEGMLARAAEKVRDSGLDNVELVSMDMTDLQFPEAHFDAANCSFGLFFIPDMHVLLQHISSRVRPGGQVVATHFREGAFSPMTDLFMAQVERYGIRLPPIGWKRLAEEAQNRELFASAGLQNIECHYHDLGYYLRDAGQWWDVIWNAGYRSLLAGLSEEALQVFKQEHLQEVAAMEDEQGVWLELGVWVVRGEVA